MKKEYIIYDISTGKGVVVMNVKNETTARFVCYRRNKQGGKYMYLKHEYED